MSRSADRRNRKRAVLIFLAFGYLFVLDSFMNIVVRLGWIHLSLPWLNGYSATWKAALGAAICFVLAWYVERLDRGQRT